MDEVSGQRFSPAVSPSENSPRTNVIIIIIIIIIIIKFNTFMQDIYNYIPKTSHVSTVYSVAALLYSQSVLHVTTHVPCVPYLYISTFCSTCTVHSMAVFCIS